MYGSFTSSASASDCMLARNSVSSRRACSATRSSSVSLVRVVLDHELPLLERLRARARAPRRDGTASSGSPSRPARGSCTATSTSDDGRDHHDRRVRPAFRGCAAAARRRPCPACADRSARARPVRPPAAANASSPLPTSMHSKPSRDISRTRTWRRRGSSSTMSTRRVPSDDTSSTGVGSTGTRPTGVEERTSGEITARGGGDGDGPPIGRPTRRPWVSCARRPKPRPLPPASPA